MVAVVVWRAKLNQKEALQLLSNTCFNEKVNKELTPINQNIKKTSNDLIAKKELPATAKNLTITTPRASSIPVLFT